MLKQAAKLEIVKEDRVYSLDVPPNAPLGEVHDVLFQMRSYIVEMINKSSKLDAKEPEEKLEDPSTA